MLADLEDGTRDLWHEVNNSMAYALSKPIRPDQNKAPRQNVLQCLGSSDPPEKIFNIFASNNEVYTIY